jgi:hypothetical protein
MELIGSVQLNTDVFREEPVRTDAEKLQDADLEEILRIVQDESWPESRDKAIAENPSWSKLYHLSDIRKNVLRPFLRKKTGKVLELGSGCGALTGILAEHAETADCLDASAKRSLVNAFRHRKFTNLTVYAGEYALAEPLLGKYSLIVVEEAFSCRMTAQILDSLYSKHLDPGGEIWILAENRLGFQYLAGVPEQLSGQFFSGLEGQTGNLPETRSKKEWDDILAKGKIPSERIGYYYPYPECRFTMALYSDSRLPEPGELDIIDNNYDRKRLRIFDDRKVQQTFLENGLFPQFSNSFFIRVFGSGSFSDKTQKTPVYVKFSNERSGRFSFYTVITADQRVEKVAVNREGMEHLRHIRQMQKELERLYGDTLEINRSCLKEDCLELEYVQGETFQTKAERCFRNKGKEAALQEIQNYLEMVIPAEPRIPFFRENTQFAAVFGASAAAAFPSGTESLPVSDIDLIMANLICDSGRKILLDYEWTFDFPIPVEFLKYRVLHYFLSGPGKSEWETEDLIAHFGLKETLLPVFQEMERNFQKYVSGAHVAVRELYTKITPGVLPIRKLVDQRLEKQARNGLRLYYAGSEEFSERNSELFPVQGGELSLRKYLEQDVSRLRIDPGEESCLCFLKKLEVNGEPVKRMSCSGKKVSGGVWFFSHPDPWFCLEGLTPGSVLELEMRIAPVSEEILCAMGGVFRPENPETGRRESLREKAGKIWKHRKN